MQIRRKVSWAIALLLLLITGCSAATEAPLPTPLPPFEVVQPPEYTVERGAVRRTLTFNGRVAPIEEQPIFFDEDGTVTGVPVAQGQQVQAGDRIAQLAVADLEQQLAEAQLALQAAELQLAEAEQAQQDALADARAALAETQLRRQQAQLQIDSAELVAAEIALARAGTETDRRLAEAQLADAQNQVQADELAVALLDAQIERLEAEIERLQRPVDSTLRIAVEQAQLNVEQLEAQLARRQATAPFDGTLLALNVRPGDTVAAFEPIATVADPSQLEVTAELAPATVGALSVGQAVTVTLPNRDTSYRGEIRQLPAGFGAEGDNRVRVTLPPDAELALGELAAIFVVLAERQDVLWLPPAAIRDFQGRTFVIVQEGEETRRRYDVRTGIEGEGRVEIVEGVEEGQMVVGE